MKAIFKFLGLSFLAFIISYLMASFYSVSFDFAIWTNEARFSVLVCTAAFMLVIGMIILMSSIDKDTY